MAGLEAARLLLGKARQDEYVLTQFVADAAAARLCGSQIGRGRKARARLTLGGDNKGAADVAAPPILGDIEPAFP
jgi:hypothetical protein